MNERPREGRFAGDLANQTVVVRSVSGRDRDVRSFILFTHRAYPEMFEENGLAPFMENASGSAYLGVAVCGDVVHQKIDEAASLLQDGKKIDFYYVHETASDEDMDALLELAKSRNVKVAHEPKTTLTDVAIQMWLAAPDMLRERHAEAIAFRQKNFLYYGGAHRGQCAFPSVNDELRLRIESAFDDWFEEHRRGRGCRIFLFHHGKNVWILIRHGMPMRREASHQEDGESSIEFYRPQQHDVLIYDTSSDEMGVHANTKGETNLYLSCFGRLVFGDEKYFPPIEKFSLDPLIEDGATSLLCEDVEGLEKIRLIEYRRWVARTGLRMMPTFPQSPLSFRTAGFPQYGWKAGLSGRAFPDGRQLKSAPDIRCPSAWFATTLRTLRGRPDIPP
jgi:hypothetical protein